MEVGNLKAIVERMSRFYLAGEMSGKAYARLAESVIASSGLMDSERELKDFADDLASYSSEPEDGLFGDDELRTKVQRMVDGFPA